MARALFSGAISCLMHTHNRAELETRPTGLGTRSPWRHFPPARDDLLCVSKILDESFIMLQRFFKLEIVEWKFPDILVD